MAIYLISGHSPDRSKGNYDPGAVANGYTEAELTRELRDLISAELTPRKVRHSIDHDADSLSQVLAKINSNESDVILDLHFNAASPQATGVEVIVPERHTELEWKSAEACSKSLATIMGIRSRGAKDETKTARKRLAVMRENGTNLLVEVCFITNINDMKAYQSKKKEVAKYLADLVMWIENQVY
jgi:N-acetylmuramoyl-L-alanine amidase